MDINKDHLISLLDSLYDNVLMGAPGAESVLDLANLYLNRNDNDPKIASDELIKFQAAKCAASGFVSGLGGALALPVAVPADLAATYYVQMRMSAAIASMYGHDIRSDQVKTFIYITLVGEGVKDVLKNVGIRAGRQFARKAIKRVSRDLFRSMNRLTLARLVPIVGGLIGAGFNSYYCFKVGDAAVGLFGSEGA